MRRSCISLLFGRDCWTRILAAILLAVSSSGSVAQDQTSPPNIVVIYADDLGIGDVGCYGGKAIPTPNIDKLATEGLRFTDGHAPSAVCTPSRYGMLTGRYPWRQKGTGILAGDANLIIAPGTTTLASILQKAGYATGVIGKWHLGLGKGKIDWNGEVGPGPQDVGFDYQYIMPATLDRVPCVFLDGTKVDKLESSDPLQVSYNGNIGSEPSGHSHPELLTTKADPQHSGTIINGVSRIGYSTGGKSAQWSDIDMPDLLTSKSDAFVERNRERPFFLYLAAAEPHVPRIPHPRFAGSTTLGPRGDVVVQLDWMVGQLVESLKKRGLYENTLIIFSSDNGPVLNDGYADGAKERNGAHTPSGSYRGGKYDAYEGGTRVPFIISWPKRIRPGVSEALVCQMDFLASLASLTKQPIPSGDALDSENILPAFLGESPDGRSTLVEQGFRGMGFRAGSWKLIVSNHSSQASGQRAQKATRGELYNLTNDPGERKDLAAEHPGKLKSLEAEFSAVTQSPSKH